MLPPPRKCDLMQNNPPFPQGGRGREKYFPPFWARCAKREPPPPVAYGDRFPFLSLRDIFPRPGEVVLWDGAFGSTEKFPAKVQSLRHARGSLFEGAGKTVRF